MRGMEVSAIETAGADWTGRGGGARPRGEAPPECGHAVADAGRRRRAPAASSRSCAGHRTWRSASSCRRRWSARCWPGDRRIERSKIRGEVSNGMLCSAIELGLGTDADGIHILGHGDEIALGTPLAEVVGDIVLDVDVKPNRGDALSMVGLAREIAAFTGGELRLPDATVAESDEDAAAHVSVRIEEPELNPRFAARWFGGVANGASPDWMQRRLIAAGMRPISAVVDVTNYVMHELGQPQHAYDADAMPGGRIVVRRARDGERLETIDHVERVLDPRNARDRRRGAGDRPCRHHGRRLDRGRCRHDERDPRVGRSSTGRPSATPPGGSASAPRRACGTRRGSGTTSRASRRIGRRSSSPRSPAPAWRAASSTTIRRRRSRAA